jgi:hypothetical protein
MPRIAQLRHTMLARQRIHNQRGLNAPSTRTPRCLPRCDPVSMTVSTFSTPASLHRGVPHHDFRGLGLALAALILATRHWTTSVVPPCRHLSPVTCHVSILLLPFCRTVDSRLSPSSTQRRYLRAFACLRSVISGLCSFFRLHMAVNGTR